MLQRAFGADSFALALAVASCEYARASTPAGLCVRAAPLSGTPRGLGVPARRIRGARAPRSVYEPNPSTPRVLSVPSDLAPGGPMQRAALGAGAVSTQTALRWRAGAAHSRPRLGWRRHALLAAPESPRQSDSEADLSSAVLASNVGRFLGDGFAALTLFVVFDGLPGQHSSGAFLQIPPVFPG